MIDNPCWSNSWWNVVPSLQGPGMGEYGCQGDQGGAGKFHVGNGGPWREKLERRCSQIGEKLDLWSSWKTCVVSFSSGRSLLYRLLWYLNNVWCIPSKKKSNSWRCWINKVLYKQKKGDINKHIHCAVRTIVFVADTCETSTCFNIYADFTFSFLPVLQLKF